jgi:hypothetical protein
LKNLPLPLFSKEGHITFLWQREVRRDFIINVFILMTLLVSIGECIRRLGVYAEVLTAEEMINHIEFL